MRTAIELFQMIRNIKAVSIIGRAGAVALFCLSLTIVHQLLCHGQTALGLYMLVEQLLKKLNLHSGHEAAEHVLHISAHRHGEH